MMETENIEPIVGAKVDVHIVKDLCQTNPHKHSNTETSEKCQTQTTKGKPVSPVKDIIVSWESKAKSIK